MRSFFASVFRLIPRPVLRAGVFVANAKFNHSVVGVFSDGEGRVLLLRHVFRKSKPWGFPSGFAGRGEDAIAAAARELYEETGLVAHDLTQGQTTLIAPRHLETIVYGRAESGAPLTLSHEIYEARWVSPDALDAGVSSHMLQGHTDLLAALDRCS